MNKIRIYTAFNHYTAQNRKYLIDILKPFIGKPENYSNTQRIAEYGISNNDIEFVDNITKCDVSILPMSWNYYREHNKIHEAESFLSDSQNANKRVISWNSGDFGVHIPQYNHLTVLRQSGYRSLLPDYHIGMPVFISDPINKYAPNNISSLRSKNTKPIIGFCGQSKGTYLKYTGDIFRTIWRNLQYYFRLSFYEPQDIYPSTLKRVRILNKIEQNPLLITNFIRRDKYRAGAQTIEERQRTTQEFYDNIYNSDYIVCVRGGGNFSVRLYETLAMGRIPILINTDCILPFENEIDWKRHVVWVEEDEINNVSDKILEFHQKHSNEEFLNLQKLNRTLWEEYLSFHSFNKRILNQYFTH